MAEELRSLALCLPVCVGGRSAAAVPVEGVTILEDITSTEAFDRLR